MIKFVGTRILKHYKIPYTSFFLQSLQAHSKYPSLLSLSDVLTEYKIENVCLKVDTSKIHSIPVPFIAHISKASNGFIYVKEVSKDHILYEGNRKGGQFMMSLEEFCQKWEGVALIAAKTNEASEPNYSGNLMKDILRKGRNPFLIFGFLFISSVNVLANHNFFSSQMLLSLALGVILITGLIVSFLLTQQTLHLSNRLTKKICGLYKKADCAGVLDSPAAQMFGIISLSEIGLLYFAGSLSALIFAPSFSTLTILFLITLLALPFTFFSVYYQARIVKKWCIMCLAVQLFLWVEFFILFLFYPPFNSFNSFEMVKSLSCFFLPVFLWTLINPFIRKSIIAEQLQTKISQLLNNEKLFKAVLSEQKKVLLPEKLPRLVLSDNVSSSTITLVTNPFCEPCAKVYEKIETLLKRTGDNIRVELIFLTTNDENEPRFKMSAHLFALFLQNGVSAASSALVHWHSMETQDYEVWAVQHAILLSGEEKTILGMQRDWCNHYQISTTPTVLLNGYYFPEMYDIENIAGFLY